MKRPGAAVAGLVVSGVAGTLITAAVADQPVLGRRWWIVILLTALAGTWIVGSWCALRAPRRTALALVGLAAVGLRLAALTGPPPLSDDVYRYAFDSKVHLDARNPYAHAPSAPEVADLRDRFLWPDDGGCADLGRPPGCTRINRPHERTIYPPAAQAWFVTVRVLSGGASGERPWQAAAMVVDLGLCALLGWGIRSAGRDPRLVALWALSPLAVVEGVLNAHVDGVVALLCAGSVIAARRRREGVAAGLLAGATLMKLYPAALLLVIARRRPRRVMSVFVGIAGLWYLPYVVATGAGIAGYVPGYLREEQYDSADRFLLLRAAGFSGLLGQIVAALILSGVAYHVWKRGLPIERGACVVLAALLLVLTPVQPWYALTLAALGVLAGQWSWSVVGLAGWPYYVAVILDHPQATAIGTLSYGFAAALLGAHAARGSRLSRRRRAPAAPEVPAVRLT